MLILSSQPHFSISALTLSSAAFSLGLVSDIPIPIGRTYQIVSDTQFSAKFSSPNHMVIPVSFILREYLQSNTGMIQLNRGGKLICRPFPPKLLPLLFRVVLVSHCDRESGYRSRQGGGGRRGRRWPAEGSSRDKAVLGATASPRDRADSEGQRQVEIAAAR